MDRPQNGRWNLATKYVFIAFALIGAYFILTEHRAHLFGALPYLFLLACPLLHFFHGHGGHGGHGQDEKTVEKPPQHQHH